MEKFYNSSPLCSEGNICRRPEESNFHCFNFRGTVLNLHIPWSKNYKKRNDSVNQAVTISLASACELGEVLLKCHLEVFTGIVN